jgi:hypothetical protein
MMIDGLAPGLAEQNKAKHPREQGICYKSGGRWQSNSRTHVLDKTALRRLGGRIRCARVISP